MRERIAGTMMAITIVCAFLPFVKNYMPRYIRNLNGADYAAFCLCAWGIPMFALTILGIKLGY